MCVVRLITQRSPTRSVPGRQSRSGSDTTRDERAVGLNASFRDQRCFGTQGLRLNFLI
jgi:hypothetical protein